MTDLLPMLQKYSNEHDKQIKKICSPLRDFLNITIFTYCFVEADGRFGYITTAIDFHEYYFSENIIADNPYLSHPALFRSGYSVTPCAFDKESQFDLRKKFNATNYLHSVQTNGSIMENFIFANADGIFISPDQYFDKLNVFKKFEEHFKREARDIIGRIKSDQFNIREVRGKNLFENPGQVPLRNNDPKIHSFLQAASGLSAQDLCELDLMKKNPFTKREKDVVQQLLLGYYSSETAKNLFLSNRTVEHHIDNIKSKLNCHSKTDLIKKLRSLESIGRFL